MTYREITAIDPGLDGAVVTVATETVQLVSMADTPVFVPDAKRKGKRDYSIPEMLALLQVHPEAFIVIEKVQAMPKQGAVSMFTFGRGYGIWLGLLAALNRPHVLVSPRRWKGAVLDGVADEDAAEAAAASRLYPAAAPLLRTKRGKVLTGRVDALMIAHYGRTICP